MMKQSAKWFGAVISMFILFALSGCQSTDYVSLPDSYHSETDYPYSFISVNEIAIAPAENGYYYVEGDFLFFLDSVSKKVAVLCNRPDCKHQYETDSEEVWKCDGYLGGASFRNVQAYEGAVYALTNGSTENDALALGTGDKLTKFSLDGTKREDIRPISITRGFAQPLRIHRGYAYYVEASKEGQALYRFPLDDPQAKTETVYCVEGNVGGFIPYGSHIYFSSSTFDQETNRYYSEILDYSIAQNQVQTLAESYFLRGIYKDQLLLSKNDRSVDEAVSGEYALLDRQTKEISPFVSLDIKDGTDNVTLETDGEQLFEWRIPLLDMSGENLGKTRTYQFSVLDEKGNPSFSTPLRYPERSTMVFAPGDEQFAFYGIIEHMTGNITLDLIDKENGFVRTNIFSGNEKSLKPHVSSLE